MKISNPTERRTLRRVGRLWGVQTDYTDAFGNLARIQDEVIVRLLSIVSEREINSLEDLQALGQEAHLKKKNRILEPVYVLPENSQAQLRLFLPPEIAKGSLEWRIFLEDSQSYSESVNLKTIRNGYHLAALKAPLPVGYHRLELSVNGKTIAQSFVLSPPSKDNNRNLTKAKSWGAFAPIYGLRSKRDWGIGDFHEMEELQKVLHNLGASFFGTLPLLPTINLGPMADPSPYSPVSRLFWNDIYLNVDELAENSPKALELMGSESFKSEKQRLRSESLVDYQGVMALKKPILMVLAREFFAAGKSTGDDYKKFLQDSPFAQKYARFRGGSDELEYQ